MGAFPASVTKISPYRHCLLEACPDRTNSTWEVCNHSQTETGREAPVPSPGSWMLTWGNCLRWSPSCQPLQKGWWIDTGIQLPSHQVEERGYPWNTTAKHVLLLPILKLPCRTAKEDQVVVVVQLSCFAMKDIHFSNSASVLIATCFLLSEVEGQYQLGSLTGKEVFNTWFVRLLSASSLASTVNSPGLIPV